MKLIKAILENNEKKFPLQKHISKISSLKHIADDCPWKKYEGTTPLFFMQNTFLIVEKKLQQYKGCFVDKLAKSCIDIAFIKVNIPILKKQEWMVIYLFKNDKKISFAFGGEPLVIFEKEYSNFLTDFWRVHSFWSLHLNRKPIDLSFAFMGLGRWHSSIVHPINFFTSNVKNTLYEHEELFENHIEIEGIEKFDKEKMSLKSSKEKYEYFLFYLEKAIFFRSSPTTSYELLIQDSQRKDYIFVVRYDREYRLFDGFEEFLGLSKII